MAKVGVFCGRFGIENFATRRCCSLPMIYNQHVWKYGEIFTSLENERYKFAKMVNGSIHAAYTNYNITKYITLEEDKVRRGRELEKGAL